MAGCLQAIDAREDAAESDVGPADLADKLATDEYRVPLLPDLDEFETQATSGGVEKDGIPAIDDPQFGGVDVGTDQLEPGDIVFGVTIDGEARAYPQRILVHHEIVNDTFGDRGVAVTYCPLTGTAIGFERGSVEFGVSGQLVNSNLIMYDRETDSWWPQILGASILGTMKGRSLREVPVVWTTWERWRTAHPDTAVLTEDTGFVRDYGDDPYGVYNPRGGYYHNDRVIFPRMHRDDQYRPKRVVLGARSTDGTVAFDTQRLRSERLLEATVGGVPYLAVSDDALDFGYVYRNPDGRSIQTSADGYVGPDGETHAADSLPLEPVNAFDAMWFAWIAFYRESVVVG
jgi:hypothetical protein